MREAHGRRAAVGEYDNYRSRAHRDRPAIREIAVANVLSRLLPVLDAVAEAAKHGELTDGFRHVAEALETELAGLGLDDLRRGGRSLRPPYPQAVACPPRPAYRPVCTEVVRPGHRVGSQLLRPAEVTVTGPPTTRP